MEQEWTPWLKHSCFIYFCIPHNIKHNNLHLTCTEVKLTVTQEAVSEGLLYKPTNGNTTFLLLLVSHRTTYNFNATVIYSEFIIIT